MEPYKSLWQQLQENPPDTKEFLLGTFEEALKDFFKERPKDRFVVIERNVQVLLAMSDEEFIEAWHFFRLSPTFKYFGTEKQWGEVADRLKHLKLI